MLTDPNLPLVVSFHTMDSVYSPAADRLRASLLKFSIPHLIAAVPTGREWLATCAFKAEFIQECFRMARRTILWVDADAEIVRDPRPLLTFDGPLADVDFAAYMNAPADGGDGFPLVNSRLCSGTLLFRKTPIAEVLLQNWRAVCDAEGRTVYDQELLYDQVRLMSVKGGLTVGCLTPSLCAVPDLMPGVEPVILQHQASRSRNR